MTDGGETVERRGLGGGLGERLWGRGSGGEALGERLEEMGLRRRV